MGLNFFGSGCGCDDCNCSDLRKKGLPNPDPRNFKVLTALSFGRYLVAWVNYPDCKNYEGNKIMIFKDIYAVQLRKLDFLDPHFCEKDHLSPVARIVPTHAGWELACNFAEFLNWKDQNDGS